MKKETVNAILKDRGLGSAKESTYGCWRSTGIVNGVYISIKLNRGFMRCEDHRPFLVDVEAKMQRELKL